MPEDMSWKYLSSASSHISTVKSYLAQHDLKGQLARSIRGTEDKPGWKAWAGQKIKLRKNGDEVQDVSTEVVNLFPGWAARRYPKEHLHKLDTSSPIPFEVEAFVSGFAISHRSPENASRSQRAFIRLAKGFASLPKLVGDANDDRSNSMATIGLTPSTEELLAQVHLPPRPTEITEDYELAALEHQLERAKLSEESEDTPHSPQSSRSSSYSASSASPSVSQPLPKRPHILESNQTPTEVLRRLHANLESRLQPFWSSVLPNRTIRLQLFASPHQSPSTPSHDIEIGPLASQEVTTAADGSFQARFRINWEDLCHHPTALHIAFGESIQEHDLLLQAQLLPPQKTPPYSTSHTTYGDEVYKFRDRYLVESQTENPTSLMSIPITHCPLRVISDIDDTIKMSNILSGARAVFHNVFVKELKDNVIPGMGEWYTSMWKRGVRFHYVSNGPFEILPILNEFFQISQLPPGSIKLKSYAGRSLFNGLLSAPATRKRAGVLEILDSFPDSRFILIGDTGEQDLELYADLARERPDNVLGVFVRDVDTGDLLEDPTGWKAMGAAGTRSNSAPLISRSDSSNLDMDETPKPKRNFSDIWSARTLKKQATPSSLNPGAISASSSTAPDYFSSTTIVSEPNAWAQHVNSDTTAIHKSIGHRSASPIPLTPSSSSSSAQYINLPPGPVPSPSLRPSSVSFRSTQTGSSTSSSSSVKQANMTDTEKRRYELQRRVYRARTQMPSHVVLRVFREPGDCVEITNILDRQAGNFF